MRTRRIAECGFTLVEVLVALLILTAGALAAAALFTLSSSSTRTALIETQATMMAAAKIEQLQSLVWGYGDHGAPVSDTGTDLSVEPAGSGGPGLRASPVDALDRNCPGYVDYLDAGGRWVGAGPTPPRQAAYVRRWSIQTVPQFPNDALIVEVVTMAVVHDGSGSPRYKRESPAGGVPCGGAREAKPMMPRADSGFSLLECVIAMALTLLVMCAAFALADGSVVMGQSQPEAVDMQERLRVARDVLFRDLARAGAGATSGPSAGPLNWAIAPIIPRRLGAQQPDPDLSARADAVTVTYVPETVAQAAADGPVSPASGLAVQVQPNCPAGLAVCGFQAGMTALVFDRTAHFDLFSIPRIQGSIAQLQSHGPGSGYPYSAGAAVTEVESHTYYFDGATSQLRQYDGDQTDFPIADNIAGFSLEYFGDPSPPIKPRPPIGIENCLYDVSGQHVPMPVLGGTNAGLAPLPLSMFVDGPWCGSGATRFDADLLRIRLVRVNLSVQATASFRRVGAPGATRESARALPDLVTTFVVSPRNLGGGR